MLEHAQALAEAYAMLPPGSTVLCAVSGGADSMCLLHWLSGQARERGFRICAAHFDHQIRGGESAADAAFVRTWCEEQSIPFRLGTADVPAYAEENHLGLEEAARTLRYAFLERTAAELGADRIATAHNADDNAETLLLHLIRGTGLRGLTGIPPCRGQLIRPLLTTSRGEILAYLEAVRLPHREDSSNTDEAYARNKLRARVIPVLKELNPRFTETCSAAISTLRTDSDYLDEQAGQIVQAVRWTEDGPMIRARRIAELPPALAPRAARRLIELAQGGSTDCSAAHLNGLVALCRSDDPSARLSLPHGLLARRVYDELLLTRSSADPSPLEETPFHFDGVTQPVNSRYLCRCRPVICPEGAVSQKDVFWLRRDALGADAVLRPRQIGDAIALPGRSGTRTVKKWLIDAKIPRRHREQLPLLCDSRGVAALAGFGPAADRIAVPGQEAWAVSFEPCIPTIDRSHHDIDIRHEISE